MTVYPLRSVSLDTLNGEKGYRMAFLRACEQRLASRYDVGKVEKLGRIEAFNGVRNGGCISEQWLTVARLKACDGAYSGGYCLSIGFRQCVKPE